MTPEEINYYNLNQTPESKSDDERIKDLLDERYELSIKVLQLEKKLSIVNEMEQNNYNERMKLEKKLALCVSALNNFVGNYCYNFCKGSDRILSEAREQAKKLLKEIK